MSQFADWTKDPMKTEEWAKAERIRVGEELFSREYECLSGQTMVTIQDENDNIINIPIEQLYTQCEV